MGVNNGYDIGVNGRDLILKTSGKIYIKVADKFYELNFRNEQQENVKTDSSESVENKSSDVVLLDTLSTENYPGDNKIVINNDELYITKGGYYKKVNVATSSQDVATSYRTAGIQDNITESSSNNLFVSLNENIWGIGTSSITTDVEFFTESPLKWNDYLFFNFVRDYFFDDLVGNVSDSRFDNIFFNVTSSDPKTWIAKTKSEIENVVLTDVYRNGALVNITEFKTIYDSFWYSEQEFTKVVSNYKGNYALFSIDRWSKALCPKTEIMFGGSVAIIIAVYNSSVLIKFKDNSVSPNITNFQKPSGSIVIYEDGDLAFLDVVKFDTSVYNSSTQSENDIHVRIGNLDTLENHSGVGSFFNENVTIKNGPFNLNADGSGNIGETLKWDVTGKLSGTFVDSVQQTIASLLAQCESLSKRVKKLEDS